MVAAQLGRGGSDERERIGAASRPLRCRAEPQAAANVKRDKRGGLQVRCAFDPPKRAFQVYKAHLKTNTY